MMGKGRLRNMQIIQQLAGTLFSCAEHLQNPQPVFITECFEHSRRIIICRCQFFHLTFTFFNLYSYYIHTFKIVNMFSKIFSHVSSLALSSSTCYYYFHTFPHYINIQNLHRCLLILEHGCLFQKLLDVLLPSLFQVLHRTIIYFCRLLHHSNYQLYIKTLHRQLM